MDQRDLELARRLVDRLEHLSADSIYAHRASGLRGSLLRFIEHIETGKLFKLDEQTQLDQLMETGFKILELAAKEMGASR